MKSTFLEYLLLTTLAGGILVNLLYRFAYFNCKISGQNYSLPLKHFVKSFCNLKPQTIDYFERTECTQLDHSHHCSSCWQTWVGNPCHYSPFYSCLGRFIEPALLTAALLNSCSNTHQFQFTRTFCSAPTTTTTTNVMQGIVIMKFVYFSFVQRANIESKVK